MKYITFAVPCYNSESYMDRCIETLLTGGKLVEIVLVDDGSSDATAEIADRYQEKYPDIIKVVHQPNSGHGEGVNQGLRHATGKYFKVVDWMTGWTPMPCTGCWISCGTGTTGATRWTW